MIILTIDSSTDTFGAAIIKDGTAVGEFCYQRPRGQLIHLFPSILEMIRIAGIPMSSISLVGVTSGPGSFTGLRLGIITARTIAQILNIKVIPVNTLDAIAGNIAPGTRAICSMLDARRNEIFAAFYRDRRGTRKNSSGYLTFTIDELIDFLSLKKEPVIATGNAVLRYGRLITEKLPGRVQLLPPSFWYPGSAGMLPLIMSDYIEGNIKDYFDVQPFYMRQSDAEEKTKA